MVKSLTYLLTG